MGARLVLSNDETNIYLAAKKLTEKNESEWIHIDRIGNFLKEAQESNVDFYDSNKPEGWNDDTIAHTLNRLVRNQALLNKKLDGTHHFKCILDENPNLTTRKKPDSLPSINKEKNGN